MSRRLAIQPYVNAINLDGASSFLVKASPTGINNGTDGSVTISGWVFLKSNVLGTFAELHVNGGTSPSFGMGQSGGQYYVFSDRVNALNNKTISAGTFGRYVGLCKWVRLTYVLTSANITVYAGATAILPTAALGTPISAGTISSLFIGKGQDVGQNDIQFLNAIAKDFRIFNGALTATEVADFHYDGIIPSSISSSFLMGEGSGTSVADSVGSNSLTATSISWSTVVPTRERQAASDRLAAIEIPYSIYINGVDGASGNALSAANIAAMNGVSKYTAEVKFWPTEARSMIIYDNSQSGVTDNIFLSMDADFNLRCFQTIGGVAKNIIGITGRVRRGRFNTVQVTYSGSLISIFLNGALVGTLAATGTLGSNNTTFRWGAYYNGGLSITFKGYMYQPRLYLTDMSLQEAKDRHFLGITSPALQAALLMDGAMTEGSGSTIADASGNGHTLTLGASASWATITPSKASVAAGARTDI